MTARDPQAPPGQTGRPFPQALVHQLGGVFTDPETVFLRLKATPTWAGPFFLSLGTTLLMALLWAHRVDPGARHSQPYGAAAVGALLGTPLALLLLGLVLWGCSRLGDRVPTDI